MKDYPSYTTVKYYYVDKKTSEKWIYVPWGKSSKDVPDIIASLLMTIDGDFYLNFQNGAPITPDFLSENRVLLYQWKSFKQIEWCIKYQPYDFDDVWCRGHAMYSKSFYKLVLDDMNIFKRDMKINLVMGKFEKYNWISND